MIVSALGRDHALLDQKRGPFRAESMRFVRLKREAIMTFCTVQCTITSARCHASTSGTS
jgi:hypothetical protein